MRERVQRYADLVEYCKERSFFFVSVVSDVAGAQCSRCFKRIKEGHSNIKRRGVKISIALAPPRLSGLEDEINGNLKWICYNWWPNSWRCHGQGSILGLEKDWRTSNYLHKQEQLRGTTWETNIQRDVRVDSSRKRTLCAHPGMFYLECNTKGVNKLQFK